MDMTILEMTANETQNFSSNVTSDNLPPAWQPIFFGTFYFILAAPSFLLHVTVFLSVLEVQGGVRQFSPFYILVTNHYLADAIKTLFYILYACPCIWAQRQVYGDMMGKILGESETIDYIAILMSTFLMSVNRALAIGAESLNEVIFTKRLCVLYNILTWVAGAVVIISNNLLSCGTVLLEKKFIFSTVCARKPGASPSSITVYIFVYGVILFYLFAIYSLSKRRRQVTNADVGRNVTAHQLRLFYQALIIWIGVVGNAIAFRIIPLFAPGVVTVVATGLIIICQSYITPVTMIIFVKDTRRGIKRLLHDYNDAVKKVTKSWAGQAAGNANAARSP